MQPRSPRRPAPIRPGGPRARESRPDDVPYGDLVRAARRSADLSQRQLAARAGVPASSVGRVESGRVQPTLRLLARLLHAAGCELVVVRRCDGERPAAVHDGTLRDGQGRRYPAHLDVRLPRAWPHGVWPPHWLHPPARYRLNRRIRDEQRWAGHVDPRVVPSPHELYSHPRP